MEDLAKLTKEEEEILMLTEEIWNRFLALPINHPMEANEIAMKIHDIQRMIISRPGFRMNQEMFSNMVKVDTVYEDEFKRILKCSEGNRIWYQLWITDLDMDCIERYFKGYNEVKRWWLPNLQMWYVFFYRKNGGKIKGVLGRERTNNLLDSIL